VKTDGEIAVAGEHQSDAATRMWSVWYRHQGNDLP
jgi:hypothetical protein